MKVLPKFLIFSAILAAAMGCGKNNESGKSNNGGICLQYGVNGQCSAYSTGVYTSGNNINLSSLVSQIPCESSGGYMPVGNIGRTQQMVQVQTRTIATAGQSYLGVTSMGDIAIVVGNGTMNAQMQVFLCPGQAMGQLMAPVTLGEYTDPACPIKVITAASLSGYNGLAVNFRDPRFGRGMSGTPFSFCHR